MKVYIYARKFAKALITAEENKAQLASELQLVSGYWSELNTYVPMYLADSEKQSRLDQLGIMPILKQLILELSRSGMMRLLPRITENYCHFKNEVEQRTVAHVTTKRALTPLEKDHLSSVLNNRHQKTVVLEEHVDPNVIDGLKVEVDYHVFDDTIATKLDLIVQKLAYEMEVV